MSSLSPIITINVNRNKKICSVSLLARRSTISLKRFNLFRLKSLYYSLSYSLSFNLTCIVISLSFDQLLVEHFIVYLMLFVSYHIETDSFCVLYEICAALFDEIEVLNIISTTSIVSLAISA